MGSEKIILIDNGHGFNTKGKRSPDGRLQEWAWTREIATMLVSALTANGFKAYLLVPEKTDISLSERVRRANQYCALHGRKNVLLISIHNNAAGADGQWHTASGWCGYVAPNASQESMRLAQTLYAEASARGLQGNRNVPHCKYWVGDFYILKRTQCLAVLTENLFQDNRTDVEWLLSSLGKQAIVQLHLEGIKKHLVE